MHNSKDIVWTLITGQFESSFSTSKIEVLPVSPSIEVQTANELKNIHLCGRKAVIDVNYCNERPTISSSTLFLQELQLSNVELYPQLNLKSPLEKAKKRNLRNVSILHLEISSEQFIDGVTHGNIRGVIYAEIENEEATKDITENSLIFPTESLVIDETHDTGLITNVDEGKIVPPIGEQVTNSGCLSFFRNGCLGLLLFLFLLALLSFLLRNCTKTEGKQKEKIEVPDDENFIKDNQIVEKDSAIVNEKTIKELKTISLPNVQFFTNSDKLLPSSEQDLKKLAVYLLQDQEVKATVFGHTDNTGSDTKNRILSQNRAQSVVNYLVEQGVQKGRLQAIGKGETEPKASNDILEGRLMNRRVEVEISEMTNIENSKTN